MKVTPRKDYGQDLIAKINSLLSNEDDGNLTNQIIKRTLNKEVASPISSATTERLNANKIQQSYRINSNEGRRKINRR